MEYFKAISDAIVVGDEDLVIENIKKVLAEGIDPMDIINEALIDGINRVGVKYEEGEYYLPELLIGARAMQDGMDMVKPLISNFTDYSLGTVILGSCKGDMHDIGKNILAIMLDGAGFKVIDLGVDVETDDFVTAVKDNKADLLAMSALLSSTMIHMKSTIEALIAEGLRDKVKIMVGGAPLNQDFADKIGADGYSINAASAVNKAKELLSL
ncbi:MAG: corrinoid protein [Clostridiales bacterium]